MSQQHSRSFAGRLWGLAVVLAAGGACAPAGSHGGDAGLASAVNNETAATRETATTESADTAAPPAVPRRAQLTPAELAEGWLSLFDGETLFGWRASSNADWKVRDGIVSVTTGDKGLLYTAVQFSNYVLKVDFRCNADTNSGIFLHTQPDMGDPGTDCYELNIAPPDNPYPTGSLVKRQKAAGEFNSRAWQTYELTVQDDRVTVKLDGREILAYTDPKPLRRGHIGLQRNEGSAEFRNIRLKPLGLARLFNGKDLSGWKAYPKMASKFTVTDEGWLHVKNGRGQLESAGRYGDFVLQLECMTHAANLNSGVFFRCIPGEEMNGYESQIHNGFKNGDRAQPLDCGTGGIFRRVSARRVAADDKTWFYKTLVADGPHVAVWVNGYQVTDWTDERKPDPNPRKGLRLEPGTIMLQGHDPTTDISFRNLRGAELPPRAPAKP